MENCVLTFCAKFLVFPIISVIISTSDASYYMKKDHSLIKPYAGITASVEARGKMRMLLRMLNLNANPNPANLKHSHIGC